MLVAEVDAVILTIHEPSCITLQQLLEEGRVMVVDPDEELPTGWQVLPGLPQQKTTMKDHVITLFDSLSAATDQFLVAFMNVSSLVKICDK